jgi:anti-anti-sigma factor
MPPPYHWLVREDVNGVTVVHSRLPRLRCEQDSREAFHLLVELVDQAGRTRLVLDLGRVAFLDSWAIGQLVFLSRKTQAAGGRLALCGLHPQVRAALEAMHLEEVLEIYPAEEQAVASFSPSPAEGVTVGRG